MRGGLSDMKDFIDKTTARSGTKINREALMAIQGFEPKTTVFNADGSITETNGNGEKLITIFNSNGTITERFVGVNTLTKTTTFNADGSIGEVISE
jgi:diaminopimelate epimerase